jgi:hypothetical protein
MRALIIDQSVTKEVEKLVDYAEKHPFTFDNMLDIKNGEEPPPGDRPEFVIEIPVGYRVVFTIELQKYKVRHLSVSVSGDGLPNPMAVLGIMELFGFKNSLKDCVKVWIENEHFINVVDFY